MVTAIAPPVFAICDLNSFNSIIRQSVFDVVVLRPGNI